MSFDKIVSIITHPAMRVLVDTAKYAYQHEVTQGFLKSDTPTEDQVKQIASEYAMPAEPQVTPQPVVAEPVYTTHPEVIDTPYTETPNV